MNLKDFSLMGEDDSSYTIGHPKGRSIQVGKSGLSDKAHEAIKALPKQNFDDGGTISIPINTDPNAAPPPVTPPVAAPPPGHDDINFAPALAQEAADNAPYGTAPDAIPDSSQGPAPASVDQPAPPAVDHSIGSTPGGSGGMNFPNFTKSLNTEENAIKAGAAADAVQGQTNAKDIQDYIQQSQAEAVAQKQRYDAFQARDAALEKSFASGKIDPNRYWNNKDTGSKISAGIGLVLSGIGSGLTHGPNMAAEMMQKAIDRDIDAQKNDQSNSMNLWKMNREAYGNDTQASLATQNQLLGAVKAKALAAAATAQGPQAQARVASLIQGIEQQKQESNYKQSLLNQGPSTGGMYKVDPAQVVPMMTNDPQMQKASLEEIGRAQNVSRNSDQIMNAFNNAANKLHGVDFVPGMENADQKQLKQLLLPNFKNIEGTVRQAAMDETFNNVVPRDFDGADMKAKRQQSLQEWMHSEQAAPISKSLGIDLNRFESTAPKAISKYKPGDTAINAQGHRIQFNGKGWSPVGK